MHRQINTELIARVPNCVRRMLAIGLGDSATVRALHEAMDCDIYGIESASVAPAISKSEYSGVTTIAEMRDGTPFPAEYFDLVVYRQNVDDVPLLETAKLILPALARFGFVLIYVANPDYGRSRDADRQSPSMDDLLATANALNLLAYKIEPLVEPLPAGLVYGNDGNVFMPDGTLLGKAETIERTLTIGHVGVLVRDGYNPIDHAAYWTGEGKPDFACAVCEYVPKNLFANPDVLSAIGLEAQIALLACSKARGSRSLLNRLFESQKWFYRVTASVPHFHPAYICQSEFWRQAGDTSMALRLLQSIQFAAPEPEIQGRIDAIPQEAHCAAAEPLPDIGDTAFSNVLMVMPPRPHYGLDVLFDGLSTVLGVGRVVEFPPKPTLHGAAPADMANYPCMFSYPGEAHSLMSICDLLRARHFDLIVWGDVHGNLAPVAVKQLMDAAGDTPLVMVDQEDEPESFRDPTLARLGRAHALYFKRECLACHDYGPDAFPLPFAYPDSRIPNALPDARPELFFWAGPRTLGLRGLYLDHAERLLGRSFTRTFTPGEYSSALLRSRAGAAFFGMGYDTVRYWELPAHGCLLIAERPPIRIPGNFVDGETAIFFENLREFDRRLRELMHDPERTIEIANAGHALLKQHHTASARARQLLARIVTSG